MDQTQHQETANIIHVGMEVPSDRIDTLVALRRFAVRHGLRISLDGSPELHRSIAVESEPQEDLITYLATSTGDNIPVVTLDGIRGFAGEFSKSLRTQLIRCFQIASEPPTSAHHVPELMPFMCMDGEGQLVGIRADTFGDFTATLMEGQDHIHGLGDKGLKLCRTMLSAITAALDPEAPQP